MERDNQELLSNKGSHGSLITMVAIVILVLIAVVYFLGKGSSNNYPQSSVNSVTGLNNPPIVKTFYMSNNLMCEIKKSTEKDEKGKFISLLNLESKNPQALFPSGLTYDMNKISEAENILVIQFVSPTSGSTDTITLYKETGEFVREAKGSFLGDYSYSSSGECK